MPRSNVGKWVARAGATGGGRTYRGQVPGNWYAALVIIVILGLVSLVFARIGYQRGHVADTTPPTTKTTWYAGFAFDVCGTQLKPVAPNLVDAARQSFFTAGGGVITIHPTKTADAGTNAVLGKFVEGYPGMALSATEVKVPKPAPTPHTKSTSTTKAPGPTSTTYRNGQTCPKGTKDAGKKADVAVTYWANAFASTGKPTTVTGNPATLRFGNNQLITIGFVPAGTKLPKPGHSVVTALLKASSGAAPTTSIPAPTTSTSTTAPTTTTAPSSTSTTSGSSK